MLYIIMNLTQFERIKTELKRGRYGGNKIRDLVAEIGNFHRLFCEISGAYT
jgi:hypothetical protein